MDWQTFLVQNGQTLVIATGCAIGVSAMAIYRAIARREINDGDRQRKRDERRQMTAGEWTWHQGKQ